MLNAIQKRLNTDEEGFTLIELMVVVLIIGILVAIAIPTFLGARQNANNKAAQANVRNALTAEKTIYADTQAFVPATAAGKLVLNGMEPNLTFVEDGATALAENNTVRVVFTDASSIEVGSKAKDGRCYWVKETSVGGTKYGTSADCTAAPAGYSDTAGAGWKAA